MGIIHEPKYGPIEIPKETQPEEPGFLLRGQDVLAPLMVDMYARLCYAAAQGAAKARDLETLDRMNAVGNQALDVAEAMRVWQDADATIIRLPS